MEAFLPAFNIISIIAIGLWLWFGQRARNGYIQELQQVAQVHHEQIITLNQWCGRLDAAVQAITRANIENTEDILCAQDEIVTIQEKLSAIAGPSVTDGDDLTIFIKESPIVQLELPPKKGA